MEDSKTTATRKHRKPAPRKPEPGTEPIRVQRKATMFIGGDAALKEFARKLGCSVKPTRKPLLMSLEDRVTGERKVACVKVLGNWWGANAPITMQIDDQDIVIRALLKDLGVYIPDGFDVANLDGVDPGNLIESLKVVNQVREMIAEWEKARQKEIEAAGTQPELSAS